ncbi:DNA repair protein XRCC2 [Denticeps clupeoides]|uniref:RecA family profile 1 domain-containing protein n=1 Tax=Denticeps clupeoides TaxID=299321 RepID=A0AAY4BWF4_9TELE|nr:DNA repair protein XRCC2 [Denticeps clupeoides]
MSSRFHTSETGAQLFARLEGRRSLEGIAANIFPEDGGPTQGDVVEMHGMEGTAKTETLYHLVSCCILPAQCGGLEVEVMFVDTDHHFDMLRLVAVLEGRLEPAGDGSLKEETLKASLRRLSVVRCSSSAQLLLTLLHLENTFCSRPSLCVLMVDSISAFYWVDRGNGGDRPARQEANLHKCAELLDRIRRDYGITVFATTHAIMRNYASSSASPSSSSTGDFDRPYLCRAWQRIVTHRVVFSKCDVLKDKKQVFSAACSTSRTRGVKRTLFCITNSGIEFL